MNLTKEQHAAVHHMGNVLLSACPGSGKTRTLVAKLLHCLEQVRGTPRRIACITYTNSAADEVDFRAGLEIAGEDDQYFDVSTIHAFCLNNILRFFHWRIPAYKNGFAILPPDNAQFHEIVADVCKRYELDSDAKQYFQLMNRDVDGTPIVNPPLTPEMALDFWRCLEQKGLLDFPNIVYWSYRLMSGCDAIIHALACKYAWFLVDEFQDTSALQVEILSLISAKRLTNFFLVGDPFQSIYGFAGARPDLFTVFAAKIMACCDYQLLDNWRSSEPIIRHAEKLLPRTPSMRAVGQAAEFSEEPRYIHAPSAFLAITDYFLPIVDELGICYGKTAIFAPWWFKLLDLGRQLRDYGVPIIGPGSRPYKRTHLFALVAEEICSYLEEPSPERIPSIERELFNLILQATGEPNYRIFSYEGRVALFTVLLSGRQLREVHEQALPWLMGASAKLSEILCEHELLPIPYAKLLSQSAEDMIEDMGRNKVDVANLSVSDLGLFANSKKSIRLLTMHKAKGLEFDAVAIIDLHDGKVPDYRAKDIEEGRRLLYVSITRAKRLLVYITDEEGPRNMPSRFLLGNGLDLDEDKIFIGF